MVINRQSKPSVEYRYFLYDPEGDGLTFYETIEERDKAATIAIDAYEDDGEGWNEEVERVIAGEVTHVATQTDRQNKPEKLDENNEDEDGNYWDDKFEYTCSYKMLPLPGR